MRPVSPVTGGATSSYGEGRVHLLRPSLHRAGKSQTPPTPARPDCCDPHRRHPGGFDAIAATLPLCSVEGQSVLLAQATGAAVCPSTNKREVDAMFRCRALVFAKRTGHGPCGRTAAIRSYFPGGLSMLRRRAR